MPWELLAFCCPAIAPGVHSTTAIVRLNKSRQITIGGNNYRRDRIRSTMSRNWELCGDLMAQKLAATCLTQGGQLDLAWLGRLKQAASSFLHESLDIGHRLLQLRDRNALPRTMRRPHISRSEDNHLLSYAREHACL